LSKAGYRVIVASSAREGIRLFSVEKIDLVVLDYWMDGMKGTAVAEEVKRINSKVPIVILSGGLRSKPTICPPRWCATVHPLNTTFK
jgi:DNA-binding response OmpR family regulator